MALLWAMPALFLASEELLYIFNALMMMILLNFDDHYSVQAHFVNSLLKLYKHAPILQNFITSILMSGF